ncbi:MAG: nucleoside monophosphate kinase [Thermoguttaceae bacterium]|jgi:adenylate kinase family enzyme|nr:nucleoside monophosphate kinase [Thermoguttaceae bacterium]
MPEVRHAALLLIGPTGSGKTPLGDLLEARGLFGRRCLHFDFGAHLRRLVERAEPGPIVSREDLDFLGQVLKHGALLEDEHFPVAQRVLCEFLAERHADARTLVVLNGLPRHAGQAEAVGRIVEVQAVVSLECTAETVVERIERNAGGDRAGRPDDDLDSIRRKLRIFGERTAPLVDYYRRRGTPVVTVEVTATATPEEIFDLVPWSALGL